jgi:hypothetical protein
MFMRYRGGGIGHTVTQKYNDRLHEDRDRPADNDARLESDESDLQSQTSESEDESSEEDSANDNKSYDDESDTDEDDTQSDQDENNDDGEGDLDEGLLRDARMEMP